MTTGRLKVVFSVPIWSGLEQTPDRRRLGVLVMTFDVGVLFRAIASIADWNASRRPFTLAVIDLRDDRVEGEPRTGLVLENPALPGNVAGISVATQTVRAPPEIVALLREASHRRPTDPQSLTFDAKVPTIAAAEPIVIAARPGTLGDLDWAVLVEER